jgi:cyclic pyranopterin phosphate synthase
MSVGTMRAIYEPARARDTYGREVKSLRLSVTQRCDLSCPHCHKEGQGPSGDEMTPEEIERLVRVGADVGIRKVKLTGGEPLIRDDIAEIVSRISPLVKEVSLTTNGSRLSFMAEALRASGLGRVNISLHTLDPGTYERLCGRDESKEVVQGIRSAIHAGLTPVKVNMVVIKGENEAEIMQMIDFCAEVGAVLQLIEYESDRAGLTEAAFRNRFFSLEDTEKMMSQRAVGFTTNELHRRRKYRLKNGDAFVEVEFVRPMHNTEFCANCTRIRMSSDGRLKPCLLSRSGEIDVLTPLRSAATDVELRSLFLKAVSNRKPYWS